MAVSFRLRSAGWLSTVGGSAHLRGVTATVIGIGQASETGSAQPVTTATPSERALPVTVARVYTLGQPAELETARSLANKIRVILGQATETDTAESLSTRVRLPATFLRFTAYGTDLTIMGGLAPLTFDQRSDSLAIDARSDKLTLQTATTNLEFADNG